jgi:hypothetical protein
MEILSQATAFLMIVVATWFVFLFAGITKDSLFYTREQRSTFDQKLRGAFGNYATICAIFGTLTSLATVYIFFIGTSKIFGGFSLACPLLIFTGAFVTNFFTEKISIQKRTIELYSNKDQISAVLPAIFWDDSRDGRINSLLGKYLSLINISGVLWLEFSVFADLTGAVYGPVGPHIQAVSFFLASLAVVFFLSNFGLRGFVFADALQAPILALITLAILGLLVASVFIKGNVSLSNTLSPLGGFTTASIFTLHVLILNSFMTLVTEGHWLRLWLFGIKEARLQVRGMGTTAIGWLILVIVGLLSGVITTASGDQGVADILRFLDERFPFILLLFWLGGAAALFATADGNLYSFFLVRAFSTSEGKLIEAHARRPKNPLIFALGWAGLGTLIYYVVRAAEFPIEKIIFVCIPFSLNLLPSITRIAYAKRAHAWFTVLSVVGYLAIGGIGLSQSHDDLAFTLGAAFVPVIISAIARFWP